LEKKTNPEGDQDCYSVPSQIPIFMHLLADVLLCNRVLQQELVEVILIHFAGFVGAAALAMLRTNVEGLPIRRKVLC
jgi:hypothetical protein